MGGQLAFASLSKQLVEWANGWSRRFVAWVVCLLMGMGGLVGRERLFIDGYGWVY